MTWHDERVPSSPEARVLRSAFFAAVCVLLSAGAHVHAGGRPVPPGTLAAAIGIVLVAGYAFGGRERGLTTLLPATFAAQYGLHHLFSWGAGHAAPSGPAPAVEHLHQATSTPMLLAHAVMALLTAYWLDRGEAAFCGLVRRLGARALALPLPAPPFPALPVPAPRRVAVPVTVMLRAAIARRGPPASISR
ncbi:hypothetical protein HNR61_003796 [Actinomadura namibiensis]|uniref:Integral membrane protein n=1 Tax=Actinomadura namibiensis TaxID=182080 RepID=A0A7W3LPY6_ACTNM|nr:MFS transporter [Actinomadura namibiensis]MBA8952156.1 hypothetical protein [Actinomadura namibiensis]